MDGQTFGLVIVTVGIVVAVVALTLKARYNAVAESHRATGIAAKAAGLVEMQKIKESGALERTRVAGDNRRALAWTVVQGVIGIGLLIAIVAVAVSGIRTISADVTSARMARDREETRRAISADRSYTLTELGYQATIRHGMTQETIRNRDALAAGYVKPKRGPNGAQWFVFVFFVFSLVALGFALKLRGFKVRGKI